MKKYPLHENNLDIVYTLWEPQKKLLDYLASIGFHSKPITFWNIGIQTTKNWPFSTVLYPVIDMCEPTSSKDTHELTQIASCILTVLK